MDVITSLGQTLGGEFPGQGMGRGDCTRAPSPEPGTHSQDGQTGRLFPRSLPCRAHHAELFQGGASQESLGAPRIPCLHRPPPAAPRPALCTALSCTRARFILPSVGWVEAFDLPS